MDIYVEERCSAFHSERKPGQGLQFDLRSSDAYGSEHMNTDIKLQVPCADGTCDMWRSHISEGSVCCTTCNFIHFVRKEHSHTTTLTQETAWTGVCSFLGRIAMRGADSQAPCRTVPFSNTQINWVYIISFWVQLKHPISVKLHGSNEFKTDRDDNRNSYF